MNGRLETTVPGVLGAGECGHLWDGTNQRPEIAAFGTDWPRCRRKSFLRALTLSETRSLLIEEQSNWRNFFRFETLLSPSRAWQKG